MTFPQTQSMKKYLEKSKITSDINEHLPIIHKYSQVSPRIVELGVRRVVSSWAMIAANPTWMKSYDVERCEPEVSELERIAQEDGIDFSFSIGDSRTIDLPEHDLLFIDTEHTYEQLIVELLRHAPNCKKYIVLHDTTTFPDLNKAVMEFLAYKQKTWVVDTVYTNNNGLTILKRITNEE